MWFGPSDWLRDFQIYRPISNYMNNYLSQNRNKTIHRNIILVLFSIVFSTFFYHDNLAVYFLSDSYSRLFCLYLFVFLSQNNISIEGNIEMCFYEFSSHSHDIPHMHNCLFSLVLAFTEEKRRQSLCLLLVPPFGIY